MLESEWKNDDQNRGHRRADAIGRNHVSVPLCWHHAHLMGNPMKVPHAPILAGLFIGAGYLYAIALLIGSIKDLLTAL